MCYYANKHRLFVAPNVVEEGMYQNYPQAGYDKQFYAGKLVSVDL